MKKQALFIITIFFVVISLFISCQKEIQPKEKQKEIYSVNSNSLHGHLQQTNTYSSEVVSDWIKMQVRLMRTTSGIPNNAFARHYAYTGIALYEAVVPGMPAYQSIAGQLNGLTGLPQTEPGLAYHWPGCANAALAYINKHMFPTTSDANKAAIDSLENALNAQYS